MGEYKPRGKLVELDINTRKPDTGRSFEQTLVFRNKKLA